MTPQINDILDAPIEKPYYIGYTIGGDLCYWLGKLSTLYSMYGYCWIVSIEEITPAIYE